MTLFLQVYVCIRHLPLYCVLLKLDINDVICICAFFTNSGFIESCFFNSVLFNSVFFKLHTIWVHGDTWASQVAPVVKASPASAGGVRDAGSIPRSGRPHGGGNGNPLQPSCLEKSMDRGAWRATVQRIARSQTRIVILHVSSVHLQNIPPCSHSFFPPEET